ncbi:hypothetical protein [Flavobacterium sp. '19STA2R22 D10 B1']|uniref:hypothetical protein n=1 Tax=Flavobacterium aerium TaxID=3037261 RepID=UPI00278BC8FE|nr:hypothetical protein [Flavobacterium sp. '19STA2R22 D10 B1']
MKKIALSILTLFLTIGLSAQNKNVQKETKTTILKVNNGTPETIIKTEEIDQVQSLQLKDKTISPNKKSDRDMQKTPVEVTKTTTVVANGQTVERKVNKFDYYMLNGKKYAFEADQNGYIVSTPEAGKLGVLRKTSNNNWIYKAKNGTTSFGYFDGNGNFLLETYDEKSDGIKVETYTFMPQ